MFGASSPVSVGVWASATNQTNLERRFYREKCQSCREQLQHLNPASPWGRNPGATCRAPWAVRSRVDALNNVHTIEHAARGAV